MNINTDKSTTDPAENLDKYPIFRGSVKHQLGPHTVGEIEEPDWYGQVMATLTGYFSEDITDDDPD